MKDIFKSSLGLFGRFVFANIMCLLISVSFLFLSNTFLRETTGYTAYGTSSESSEVKELYTYNNSDGEDTNYEYYTNQGYKVSKVKNYADLSTGSRAIFLIVNQVFCFGLLISFMYPVMYSRGSKDSNLVRFKHITEDKFRGFKMGLLALVPSLAVFIVLIVLSFTLPKFPVLIYKYMNSSLFSFYDLVIGKVTDVGDLKLWQFILLAAIQLFIPLITGIAYLFGYKEISFSEFFIDKNKEK